MNIEQLITEASWRIRAFLGAPESDSARVGWRGESSLCPLAEWLNFEYLRSGSFPPPVSIDAEEIIVGETTLMNPSELRIFVDLIDGAILAPDAWLAEDARVTREEAEAALAEAERRAVRLLLPKQAASVPRCAYSDEDGRRCGMPASTPVVHGFFQRSLGHEHEHLCRGNCAPFIGGVCSKHWLQVVIPPASWWPQEAAVVERDREAALV